MDFLNPIFEGGRIDFEGQKLATRLTNIMLTSSGLIAFIVGIASKSIKYCFLTYALGIVVTFLVVLPPSARFRSNPTVWLKKTDSKRAPAEDTGEQDTLRKTSIEDIPDDE